jgi:hypothetical protein
MHILISSCRHCLLHTECADVVYFNILKQDLLRLVLLCKNLNDLNQYMSINTDLSYNNPSNNHFVHDSENSLTMKWPGIADVREKINHQISITGFSFCATYQSV